MGTYKTNWQLTETVMPEDMNRIEGNIKENNTNLEEFKKKYTTDSKEENKKIDAKAEKDDVLLKVGIPEDRDCNSFKELNAFCTFDTGAGDFRNTPEGTLAKGSSRVFLLINRGFTTTRFQQEFINLYPQDRITRYIRNFNADGNGIWGNWYKVYDEANKPTPNDIGTYAKQEIDSKDTTTLNNAKSYTNGELAKKLNLTGGTITGDLTVSKTNAVMRVMNGICTFRAVANNADKSIYLQAGMDTSDSGNFKITGMNAKDLNELNILANGQTSVKINSNPIYHVGNKPTPADIGASPSNHNHDSAYLGKTAKAESAKNADAVNGRTFNWVFGTGNPTHIWGSSGSSTNMQVWSPANITVGRATSAGSADSVAWGNVTGKPSTFAPSSHDHSYLAWGNNLVDCRQSNDFVGLDKKNNVNVETWYGFSISNKCASDIPVGAVAFSVNARNGMVWAKGDIYAKGNQRVYHPGNKPSPADIGASPSSHNHDGRYIPLENGPTNESYRIRKSYIEVGTDDTRLAYLGVGPTDTYINNKKSGKYLALKDSGDLLYDGKKVLRDIQGSPLWQGFHHMSGKETVTPSKPLSQCNNGWVIVWSDFDDGVGPQNWNVCYSYIPKNTIFKTGQNTTLPLTGGEDSWAIKTLYIYDTYFKGNDTNKNGGNYDVVIRAVLEY